ncbi:MAG TPA: hypothetical protein VMX13_08985 [Sedimentisphaerales bacterium]|nr:hypothetical protein [Sedimentisphaerales bacterium]
MTDGTVNQAWEAKAPDFDAILSKTRDWQEKGPFVKNIRFSQFFLSTKPQAQTP